jgi:hypothetical protein
MCPTHCPFSYNSSVFLLSYLPLQDPFLIPQIPIGSLLSEVPVLSFLYSYRFSSASYSFTKKMEAAGSSEGLFPFRVNSEIMCLTESR